MELIIVVVIALLVFGPGKLGDLGGALGRGMREFRKNVDGDDDAPTSDSTTSAAPLPDERSSADFAVCGACNARNPGGAKFCATCGSAMAA
jgi:sec-independent protein translocase protein TatA